MCGVAAAIGVAEAGPVVEAMARTMAHRGPDDHGSSTLRDATGLIAGAMAHRRLSVIDLTSGGHQPMATRDGRFTIAFNGEIYNYRALDTRLTRDRPATHPRGDTAVLLDAWATHGPQVVHDVEGMFAFALWDAQERALYLARDAFGIKPLYFARVGTGVLVASEVRALLASGRVARNLDDEAVAGYLTFGAVQEPATIIAGIRMVPAGTVLRFTMDGAACREDVVTTLEPFTAARELLSDRQTAARALRQALEESIDRHLVSDVPVSVFLSGGLDSSALAALTAQRASTAIDGFTVTFAERRFDEREVARRVAERHGIRHHEIPLGSQDLLAALPAAFAAMDQPTPDGINTYVVSQAVRARGSKVVLSGLGGDELFGGYPSFRRARSLARYARIPEAARRAAARVAARVGGVRGAKVALGLRTASPADAAYLASRTMFGERQVLELSGGNAPRIGEAPAGLTSLQRVSWHELTGYMRNTLLRDSDVFSMAHGLELRVPFIDRAVASIAFSVTDALKLARGVAKSVLVDAVRDLVPRAVWDRPKQGFVLPFADWMRGPLASEIGRTLGDRDRVAAVGLSPRAARAVWNGFLRNAPGVSWSRPWALYSLVRWATLHDVSAANVMQPPLDAALAEAAL